LKFCSDANDRIISDTGSDANDRIISDAKHFSNIMHINILRQKFSHLQNQGLQVEYSRASFHTGRARPPAKTTNLSSTLVFLFEGKIIIIIIMIHHHVVET
jgi:hypothetical protein